MKVSKEMIKSFLSAPSIAIAGVSRDPKKFGYAVLKELKQKGLNVIPVNPEADLILDTPCYRDIRTLPDSIGHLLIVTPKSATLGVLKEAEQKGIRNIWIQQHSDTPEALEFARNSNMNLIHGKCILMFSEPVVSLHKFHRNILKFFGRLPK